MSCWSKFEYFSWMFDWHLYKKHPHEVSCIQWQQTAVKVKTELTTLRELTTKGMK